MYKLATLVKTKYAMQVDNDDFIILSGLTKMLDNLENSNNKYISAKGLFANFSTINNCAIGKVNFFEKNLSIAYFKEVKLQQDISKALFVIKNGIASYYNIIDKKYLVKILREIKEMNFTDLFFHELYFSARLHSLGKELYMPNTLVYIRQVGTSLDSNKLNEGWGKLFLTRDLRGDFEKFHIKLSKELKGNFKKGLLDSFSYFLSHRITSVKDFFIGHNVFIGMFKLLCFLSRRVKKLYPYILSPIFFITPARLCKFTNFVFIYFLFRKTQLNNSEITCLLDSVYEK
jgi:hypothetical protein